MQARIAKLESDVTHITKSVDRLATVPERLGVLETKVDALPTKDYLSEKLDSKFDKSLVKMGIVVTIIGTVLGLAFKFIGA